MDVIVALLDETPSPATARQWRDFVTAGGKLVLLLRPGMESTWAAAPAESRTILEQLLPSAPYEITQGDLLRVIPASAARQDPVTSGLADDPKATAEIRANRIVGLKIADQRSTQILLATAAGDRRAPADRDGLLYSRKIGRGRVYTWACVPDGVITNLGTHPLFLPLLVNQCLRGQETSRAANVQIGTAISIDGTDTRTGNMELRSPGGQIYEVAPQDRNGRRTFTYTDTAEPGIYQWRKAGDSTLRVTNVTGRPRNLRPSTARPSP